MTKKELFEPKNIYLTSPSIELLPEIIGMLGYSAKQYDDKKTRDDVLSTLKILFELNIIYVYKWLNNPDLNEKKMSIDEILSTINRLWFKGAQYPDIYVIVMFGPQKWYVDKLRKVGLTDTTDWKWFVDNNIGDLEKWIKKNDLKNTNHIII